MKTRVLGSVALPDPGKDTPVLDIRAMSRAGLAAQGSELWPAVSIALSERSPKVGSQVVFVAGSSGERTVMLVAAALALGAAASGLAVILVDPGGLQLRLGGEAGGAPWVGFAELAGGVAAADSMHESGIAGLVLVPAGRAAGGLAVPRPSLAETHEALDILRAHAEIVVVPGSIWQGDEASAFLSLADAYLVVRRPGGNMRGEEELPELVAPRGITGVNAVPLGVIEAMLPGMEAAAPRVARAPEEDEEEGAAAPPRVPGPPGSPVERVAAGGAKDARVARAPQPDKATAARSVAAESYRRSPLRTLLIAGGAAALVGAGAVVAVLHPGLLHSGGRAPARVGASWDGSAAPAFTRISGAELAARDSAGDSAKTNVVPATDTVAPDTAAPAVEAGATPPAAASKQRGFVVIVSSFKVRANAEKTADGLRREGHSPAVWQVDRPGMGRWYRVVADTLATRGAADSLAAIFREGDQWRDAVVAACE